MAEGAAVATAALDALCDNGATTVCATHVAALKALPARDPRYVSLAFRVDEAGPPGVRFSTAWRSRKSRRPRGGGALGPARRRRASRRGAPRRRDAGGAADANADALWSALDAARAEAADAAQARRRRARQLAKRRMRCAPPSERRRSLPHAERAWPRRGSRSARPS